MKSSIPVPVERPSRHAASLVVPGPLQVQSVGVASKLEASGGFTRNRRTVHPHTGARRRQQELTSSATHEMHLPPREVRGGQRLRDIKLRNHSCANVANKMLPCLKIILFMHVYTIRVHIVSVLVVSWMYFCMYVYVYVRCISVFAYSEVAVLATSSQASIPHCRRYHHIRRGSPCPVPPPLPLPPSPHTYHISQLNRSDSFLHPQADW